MRHGLAILLVATGLALAGAPARADLDAGIDAYYAGDYETALEIIEPLAREEHESEAAYFLGRMYEFGEGVPPNGSRAVAWYQRAAEDSYAPALYRLGLLFETGEAMPLDFAKALEYYQQASELDHLLARKRLAVLYATGRGTLPDYGKAASLLQDLADSGDEDAREMLIALLREGTVPEGSASPEAVAAARGPTSIGDVEAEAFAAEEIEGEVAPGTGASGPGAETGQPAAPGKGALGESAEPMPETMDDTAPSEPELAEPEMPVLPDVSLTLSGEPKTAGGRAVHAFVESMLVRPNEATDQAGMGYDGTLRFDEADDGTVVVSSGDFAYVTPDMRWDLGALEAVFVPAGEDRYDVTWTMPSVSQLYDASGQQVGTMTIADQHGRGVFLVAVRNLVDIDMRLADIAVHGEAPGEPVIDVAVDEILVDMSMTEGAPGLFTIDEAEVASMSGLSVTAEGTEVLAIDRMGFQYILRDFNYAWYLGFFDEYLEIYESALDADADDEAMTAEMQAAFDRLVASVDAAETLFGDVGYGFTLEGLRVREETGADMASIGRMSHSVGIYNLDGVASDVEILYAHEGLAVAEESGLPLDLLPHDVDVAIAVEELPVNEASRMALEMVGESLASPDDMADQMEMAGIFMMMGLQQSLIELGTTFDIRALDLTSNLLQATTRGSLVADQASPMGFVGEVNLEVVGMDAAVDALSVMDDSDAQEAAQQLAFLRTMGAREERNGGIVHVYALVLTPEGKMLLNGEDMEPLMGGAME